jgi:hypothetical protein
MNIIVLNSICCFIDSHLSVSNIQEMRVRLLQWRNSRMILFKKNSRRLIYSSVIKYNKELQ